MNSDESINRVVATRYSYTQQSGVDVQSPVRLVDITLDGQVDVTVAIANKITDLLAIVDTKDLTP